MDLLYQNLFYTHPEYYELFQYQQEGKIDRQNYGIRLKINNDVNGEVKKIINSRHMRMMTSLVTSNDRERDEKLILEYVNKAYDDTRSAYSNMGQLIWNIYANYPKLKFFPSRNSATSMMYYGQSKKINFLSNVNVEGWDSLGSIKSNVFTGYFAPVQISLTTMISRITPEKIDESAINSLNAEELSQRVDQIDSTNSVKSTLYKTISGGGEVSVVLRYPIFSYNIAQSLNEFSATIEAANYSGFDLPIAGRFVPGNQVIFNNVFQIQPVILLPFAVFSSTGEVVNNTEEKFNGLSLRGSFNVAHGSSKFYEALHINKKPFSFYSISMALIFDPITIQYTFMEFTQKRLDNSNYNRLQVILNTNIGR